MNKIIVSKVHCKKCNEIIESKHRPDYKSCECGSISIDGGTYYQQFSFPNGATSDEFIEFSYSVYEDILTESE